MSFLIRIVDCLNVTSIAVVFLVQFNHLNINLHVWSHDWQTGSRSGKCTKRILYTFSCPVIFCFSLNATGGKGAVVQKHCVGSLNS